MKAVFFDLDGTMLPMNQDEFVKIYFTELCKRFCPVLKIGDEALIKAVWKATAAMIKNDGSEPNINKFWKTFAKICGKDVLKYVKDFDNFYVTEFFETKSVTGYNPNIPEAIKVLKNKGYTLAAATNPIFPNVATYTRLGWAGVSKDDFAIVTTYENSTFCKPNPKYYLEIMEKLGLEPEDCMMVGNDIDEDILAGQSIGMDTFLITDCMINREDKEFESKQGTPRDLLEYVRRLPDVRKAKP